MLTLPLVIAPDPIFRRTALPVERVDDQVRAEIAAMFETLAREQGVGLGANMVGLLKRIIVIDLKEGGVSNPLPMINPEVTWTSDETQTFREASLSFPGVSADIMRPSSIKAIYLDLYGKARTIEAEGFLATVIQHEMDYLDGRTFLDHLSPLKRKMALKKLNKRRSNKV